jgi:hypothetical protein
MSEQSQNFRNDAAKHLRQSRHAKEPARQENQLYLARAYKKLAHNEEWLAGEPEKSRENRV